MIKLNESREGQLNHICHVFTEKTKVRICKKIKLPIACSLISACLLVANLQLQAKANEAPKDVSVKQNEIVYTEGIKASRRKNIVKTFTQGYNKLLPKALPKMFAGLDTCPGTSITALPYSDLAGTTIGKADNYDLPTATVSPTVTACPTCTATGGGPAISLPRGAVYTGTGTAPDSAYTITFTSPNNSLNVTVRPVAADLALVVYAGTCSSLLSDAIVVSDVSADGIPESVSISTMPAGTYNIVVDGYSSGGAPPGPSDTYSLSVTGTGTVLGVTAASVSVGGRVLTAEGRGIGRTTVVMTDGNGNIRKTITNAFGYYRFDQVTAGQNVVVSVSSKRYQFGNEAQTLFAAEDFSDLNFTALP